MRAEGVAGLVVGEEEPSEITHGTTMSLLSVTGTHTANKHLLFSVGVFSSLLF